MGTVIKARELSVLAKGGLQKPIIYCSPGRNIIESAVPINVELAKRLSAVKQSRRTMRMEQILQQLLDTLPDNVKIKDFDVLFNPVYEVDVLKIMSSLAKAKAFSIVWPGKYEDEKLIYAEEGYRDYKVFEIKNYDVTCVI